MVWRFKIQLTTDALRVGSASVAAKKKLPLKNICRSADDIFIANFLHRGCLPIIEARLYNF